MKPWDRHQWVLAAPIGHFEKAVLHVLAHRAGPNLECFTSMERLASDAGMSRRKAQNVIADLEAIGLITVTRSQGRNANRYQLNPAPYARLEDSEPGTGCAVYDPPTVHGRFSNRAPQVANRAQRAPEHIEQGFNKPPSALTVWDLWVSVAGQEKRPLLGKLIAEFGEGEVAKAVAVTSAKQPADPVGYVRGVLAKAQRLNGDREWVSPV